MKRILTTIFLPLVIVFSVHPIFTLHFCGDQLKSLKIGTSSNNTVCCMPTKIANIQNVKLTKLKVLESKNSCCTTINLDFATDNFISSSSQTTEPPIETSLISGWFTLNYLFNLTELNTSAKNYNHFSIRGFPIKDLDFLSLFCVYLI